MSNVSAINEAIAQAKAAAAAAVAPAPANNVVAFQAPAVAVAVVATGRPIKLGELIAAAGMQVKAFLKVDKAGFAVGKDLTFFDEIPVEFKLNSIKPFYGCRYGDPAKYLKSFDRITDSRTKRSWAEAVAEAQRMDARCTGDYPSADMPLTLRVADLLPKKGGEPLCKVGEALGLTLSITNFSAFASFIAPYENLRDAGLMPDDVLLRGKIVHQVMNRNGNTWGIATFVDFLVVDESVAEAA